MANSLDNQYRDATLSELASLLAENVQVIEELEEKLVEKEAVIQELYKRYHNLKKKGQSLKKRFLTPKLGSLYHYSACPLVFPGAYRLLPKVLPQLSITIVTPSYNQAAYLEETMLSVLEQGCPHLEYIVQDGGSTDDSVEIIGKYANRLVRWDSKKDNGQGQAINWGFAGTTGEIMAYLNSDDILLPGTLNYVLAYFEAHPEVDVVYGHRVLIDAASDEIGRWILPAHDDEVLKWVDFVPQETLFWRRRLWDKISGHIDESFHFALDWDLLLRFQAAGAKMVRLPRFLGAFRVHQAQKTSAKMESIGMKEIGALRRRTLGYSPYKFEVTQHVYRYVVKSILLDKLYWARLLKY